MRNRTALQDQNPSDNTTFHIALHHRTLYKYIHAHHHKVVEPVRGYLDAGNEHPFEQIGALLLHFSILCFIKKMWMLDITAVVSHLILKAAFSCFNHSGRDISLNFVGIRYSAKAHTLHHRLRKVHYHQIVCVPQFVKT